MAIKSGYFAVVGGVDNGNQTYTICLLESTSYIYAQNLDVRPLDPRSVFP